MRDHRPQVWSAERVPAIDAHGDTVLVQVHEAWMFQAYPFTGPLGGCIQN